MARLTRIVLPGCTYHVLQRGNDRSIVFRNDEDRRFFLRCLWEAAARESCDVHGYVLMGNHFHLMVTPQSESGLSRMIQQVGRRFVGNVNRIHGRTGTLWEGRFRSCLLDTHAYAFSCLRYIDLNPVRAGLARSPAEFPWSSYRHHAGILADNRLVDHTVYLSLGDSSPDRARRYRDACQETLPPEALAGLREGLHRVSGRPRKKTPIAPRPFGVLDPC
jgi:putative transposase